MLRAVRAATARLFVVTGMIAGTAGAVLAEEDCVPSSEAGTWVNPSAKVRELSSIELEYFCPEDPVYGAWRMRMKTRCHPRDCSWGWTRAERRSVTTFLGSFQGFYTTSFVKLDVMGGRMSVEVENRSLSTTIDGIKRYMLMRK
ncbi:MAG: hypothetical protein C0606_06575 [Hyphomicrobiales bacterium]|nr:MAG: hypothetical protein C0606_06575 [Hyphomicrobiales bacterium]